VAPEFTLASSAETRLSLGEFRGQALVIAFYPADFSPVCGDQLALYNEVLPDFAKLNAQLTAISVDGVWCHAAFREARHLHFPLLADFEPKGAVARQYGAYDSLAGVCERALFVLDTRGIVRWSFLSPSGVNPGADGIFDALEALAKE
jgi:peroxiredoxin